MKKSTKILLPVGDMKIRVEAAPDNEAQAAYTRIQKKVSYVKWEIRKRRAKTIRTTRNIILNKSPIRL